MGVPGDWGIQQLEAVAKLSAASKASSSSSPMFLFGPGVPGDSSIAEPLIGRPGPGNPNYRPGGMDAPAAAVSSAVLPTLRLSRLLLQHPSHHPEALKLLAADCTDSRETPNTQQLPSTYL